MKNDATTNESQMQNDRQHVDVQSDGRLMDSSSKKRGVSKVDDESIMPASHEVVDEDRKILYSPDVQRSAINNLIIFSILIFVVPTSSMYLLKKHFFEDYMNFGNSQASLYAGVIAIVITYSLVAIFACIAFKEERRLEEYIKKKE